MKPQLFIIGGGHAGNSAALSAARAKMDLGVNPDIHLIDKNPFVTIKPRLYEEALEEVIFPFAEFLDPLGVKFHQDEITELDLDRRQIIGKNQTYHFDALILCPGSEMDQTLTTHNLNSYEAALALRRDLHQLIDRQEAFSIAVLGGGFTGTELATELPNRIKTYAHQQQINVPSFTISLFDKGEVGASLGENPKPTILEALHLAKINRESEAEVTQASHNHVSYRQKGKSIERNFDLVINTAGQKPNRLARNLPFNKDESGRILVDSYLNPPQNPNVFVAGDVAAAKVDASHTALMTCQQGRPQGRYTGYNAMAFLSKKPMKPYSQPNYVTCLDLGAYGALYTQGWDRKVLHKGKEAKKIKIHINRERIYPPRSGKKEDLYAAGQLEFVPPTISINS